AGDLVSAGGGTGTADGAGAGVADGVGGGGGAGAGDCASAAPPNAMAAIGISAIKAKRKVLKRFILSHLHHIPSGRSVSRSRPHWVLSLLTRKGRFRPMTDASCSPSLAISPPLAI